MQKATTGTNSHHCFLSQKTGQGQWRLNYNLTHLLTQERSLQLKFEAQWLGSVTSFPDTLCARCTVWKRGLHFLGLLIQYFSTALSSLSHTQKQTHREMAEMCCFEF